MNQLRGILMLAMGAFALYQGWVLHTGQRAFMAYGLAVLAFAMGIWRLTRKPPTPRV